jgi:type VI secretion system secreted protein Hcp
MTRALSIIKVGGKSPGRLRVAICVTAIALTPLFVVAPAGAVNKSATKFATISAHVDFGSVVISTLVLPGIAGEGSPAGHGPNSIELQSWSWGASNSSSVAGSGRGKASLGEFSIKKVMDKSSPIFMKACTVGSHLGTAYVYLDQPSSGATGAASSYTTVAKFTLTNTRAASCSYSSSPGDTPVEEVTFAYSTITYTTLGAGGTSVRMG